MGQTIEVTNFVMGDLALFDTDRSITGQDGQGFGSAHEAQEDKTTAARLAAALFGSDPAVDHVFVSSNQVTVRRTAEWKGEAAEQAAAVIRDFFVFYEENRGTRANGE